MVNAQLSKSVHLPRSNHPVNIAIYLTNLLGGLDALVNANSRLHGWGGTADLDPVLYRVDGFDPTARRYKYVVNEQFGRPSAANLGSRIPFRFTIDVSVDLGRPLPVQQIDRWLKPGRAGRPGPRLSAPDLKRRYAQVVSDPYEAILAESDSLFLLPHQIKALQEAEAGYQSKADSTWSALAENLANLDDEFDAGQALRRQEAATDEVWELARTHLQKTLPSILSPIQLDILPWPAGMLYKAKKPVHIRVFMTRF
jgi:hypothetical protein